MAEAMQALVEASIAETMTAAAAAEFVRNEDNPGEVEYSTMR
jgi:hypothetical protein